MNDLFASPRLKELLPKVKTFVEEEILPLERDLLTLPFNQVEVSCVLLREKVKAQGLWGLHLSEAYGGKGLSLVEFGQISEVLGSSPLGHYVFNCHAPDIGNAELLMHFGTEEQKEKYLQPLLEGKIRSCFSMTEPQYAGSNPILLATTAVKEGDNYLLNGYKWFSTAADGATFAIVMAITNPEAPKHSRASMLIVPTDTPGYELVRNISVMGEEGEGYMSHAEIKYQNCLVPQGNRLGKEGEGFVLAQQRLGPGRIHHCMRWIGICERALDLMCRRAVKRELDAEVFLADKQVIQHWIAEAQANIQAARLMVLHTAYVIDQKGSSAAREEISMVKFFVSNILMQILDRAIQVHGALGITDDSILSFWYRHERGARIYDGADEVHKSALAKSILKKYKK